MIFETCDLQKELDAMNHSHTILSLFIITLEREGETPTDRC